ncbi:MAG TPA: hypothetical protein P5205_13430 [Candidatus Paceibacterota bacterium]|nr:hypothetical protein [Verrucomicrobiota bacterium]HSA11363.1 hypothetical protein [Candidatus Paceibacterota bacterium]
MKKNAASKQSKGWLTILVFVVPCLWALAVRYWDWMLATIAGLLSVYLVLEVWVLVKARRAARRDRERREDKTPGT